MLDVPTSTLLRFTISTKTGQLIPPPENEFYLPHSSSNFEVHARMHAMSAGCRGMKVSKKYRPADRPTDPRIFFIFFSSGYFFTAFLYRHILSLFVSLFVSLLQYVIILHFRSLLPYSNIIQAYLLSLVH